MNSLMILSHAAVHSHFHAAQIVPIVLVSILATAAIVFFGRRSIARK